MIGWFFVVVVVVILFHKVGDAKFCIELEDSRDKTKNMSYLTFPNGRFSPCPKWKTQNHL